MILKTQYRRLLKIMNKGEDLKTAAAKSGIDPKTARKYLSKDNFFSEKPANFAKEQWPEDLSKPSVASQREALYESRKTLLAKKEVAHEEKF